MTIRKQNNLIVRTNQRWTATDLEAMTRLQEVGAFCAHGGNTFNECIDEILQAAIALTGAEKGNIQLVDESSALKIATQRGFNEAFLNHFAIVRPGHAAACGAAMNTGQRVVVENVTESEIFVGQSALKVLLEAGVYAVQSTPLVSTSGKMLGMISTHFIEPHKLAERELRLMDLLARQAADYLERKQAEAEREQLLHTEQGLRQVAEEANRLKDEFLAIMSHELRNPLNVILGYSELLFRSEELSHSPQLIRMTDSIRRNAVTQARLIRDLLDLSRLRSGKISLNNETVSLAMAVNNAVETVRADADAKNITILVVADGEPLFIEGDPVRLEQIVWNLLNNAVKFTPPGGTISLRLDEKDNQVFLSVQDTGRGIEPSFLPHVFEMFRQADAGTNRVYSGMGVGLAIVQQLVHLHEGAITAFSAGPGEGATFTLQFPLSLQPQTSPASALKLVTTLKNVSILIVDDSEDTTEMLATLLSLTGANVVPVTSGDEALRVIGEREFDVVLSDISMPVMDGFELLKRLRQIPGKSEVPVLALTGFGRPEDIERARSEGFFSHVTKPFEMDTLIGVLQRVLKKKK